MENGYIVEYSPSTVIKLKADVDYEDQTSQTSEDARKNDPLDYSANYIQQASEYDKYEIEMEDDGDEEIGQFIDPSEARYSAENPPKDVWYEAPTKLLFACLENMQPQLGKSFALKNKIKMWQQIQKVLAEEGYTFTVAQVQGRYRSLERRYKQMKEEKSITNRVRRPFPYKSDMQRLYRKIKAAHTEFEVDMEEICGDDDGGNVDACVDGGGGRDSQIASTGSTGRSEKSLTYSSGIEDFEIPVIKRRRKRPESTQEKLYKCLQNIDKRQTDFNKEMLKILKKKNEIEEKRNEILGKICEKLVKS